jgi:hypothetical protein
MQNCSHKPEGKRSHGRIRPVNEYNIEMDLKEIGCEGADLVQFRIVPSGSLL